MLKWIDLIFGVRITTEEKERKRKEEYLYNTLLRQGTHKALRHGSHSFTCKQHHACLSCVSVHQMAPPQQLRQQTSNCSLLLIYRPWKDERLSWPGWLTCRGWVTHLSGHPSATGPDMGSGPVADGWPPTERETSPRVRVLDLEIFNSHHVTVGRHSSGWALVVLLACTFPELLQVGPSTQRLFYRRDRCLTQCEPQCQTAEQQCWSWEIFRDTESLLRYIKTYNNHKVSH